MELTAAGYSSKTINRRLSAVRALYRWLVHEGITDEDAAAALASPKVARLLPHTLSDEDIQALIDSCDVDTAVGLRDRTEIELLYATGARISELSGIDVADVDFGQGQVRLFGKGSKERIVPVYEAALDTVRAYLIRARPKLRGKSAPDPDALFRSTRGNRMSADSLRRSFEQHVALAGIDGRVTPHAMRHSYATELLGGGADLRSVQELLGHESLSTTQIYTHLSVDRLKDATRQAHPRGSE
jgi:integrase/recombinase XerD